MGSYGYELVGGDPVDLVDPGGRMMLAGCVPPPDAREEEEKNREDDQPKEKKCTGGTWETCIAWCNKAGTKSSGIYSAGICKSDCTLNCAF